MWRIIFDFILYVSVFLFPWWFALILAIVGLLLFRSFYEIIFLGIVIDSLYNASTHRFYGLEFIVTFISIILFTIIEMLKRRVRIHRNL